MSIKLLSTGACADITIREIMLINIISSASWTLQGGCGGGRTAGCREGRGGGGEGSRRAGEETIARQFFRGCFVDL